MARKNKKPDGPKINIEQKTLEEPYIGNSSDLKTKTPIVI